jgi:hypothetical protein
MHKYTLSTWAVLPQLSFLAALALTSPNANATTSCKNDDPRQGCCDNGWIVNLVYPNGKLADILYAKSWRELESKMATSKIKSDKQCKLFQTFCGVQFAGLTCHGQKSRPTGQPNIQMFPGPSKEGPGVHPSPSPSVPPASSQH